jgi:endonuclease G
LAVVSGLLGLLVGAGGCQSTSVGVAPEVAGPPDALASYRGLFAYGGEPVAVDGSTVERLENLASVTGYDPAEGVPRWCAFRLDQRYRPRAALDVNEPQPDPRVETEPWPTGAVSVSGYAALPLAMPEVLAHCYGRAAGRQGWRVTGVTLANRAGLGALWPAFTQRVLSWSQELDTLWVVSGPVYSSDPLEVAERPVPAAVFVILVDEYRGAPTVLALLLPQSAGGLPHLRTRVVSVDRIERLTGLDFLSALPDDEEAVLESQVPSVHWRLEAPLEVGVSERR